MIRNHWVYQNPVFLQIWIEFLLLASFDRQESLINNKMVVLKKGQFIFGRQTFARRLGCSEYQLRAFISAASTAGMIAITKFAKYSIITVTNYDAYQENRQHFRQHNRQHRASIAPHIRRKEEKGAKWKNGTPKKDLGI